MPKFVNASFCKPLVEISSNLQLRHSWGQRWTDYVLRLWGQRSGSWQDQIWFLKITCSKMHVSGEGIPVDSLPSKTIYLYWIFNAFNSKVVVRLRDWCSALNNECHHIGGRQQMLLMADIMTGCRYFDSVDICKYRSDWMESRQKIALPSSIVVKPLVTRVEVFEATEVDVGLFQEGARSRQSVLH